MTKRGWSRTEFSAAVKGMVYWLVIPSMFPQLVGPDKALKQPLLPGMLDRAELLLTWWRDLLQRGESECFKRGRG